MISAIMRRRFLVGGGLALPVAVLGGANLISAEDGKRHEVEIKDFMFKPSILKVRSGDQIRWTNWDISPHTATAEDGSWDTGELRRGESVTVTVTEAMFTAYLCAFHPTMRAELVIL